MSVSIIMVIHGQVIMMVGIESMMKTQRAIFGSKVMVMWDDAMQHQQHVGWQQAKNDHPFPMHMV